MPLSPFVDISSTENLHWLAVLGSSVILSLASSLVPNYVETSLDMRSHNRARLFNETAARLHIAYIIFLLTLITSDDIDKTGNKLIFLSTLTTIIVFILMWAIIVSGRTMERIRKSKDREGKVHECNIIDGICHIPVGRWIGCRVCLLNALLAFVFGVICLGIAVNPVLIKHDQSRSPRGPAQSQIKDYHDVLKGMYKQIAHQTKEQFEKEALVVKQYKDDKLNVSYWFSNKGVIHQLGTTHEASAGHTYEVNEESIIGCGFFYQNSSVRWDDKSKQVIAWPYNGTPSPKDSCKYRELEIEKITSIACATYNGSGTKNPENAVGICVFTTGTMRNVFGNENYHEFLKGKAEDFYNSISPLLKNKTLITQ